MNVYWNWSGFFQKILKYNWNTFSALLKWSSADESELVLQECTAPNKLITFFLSHHPSWNISTCTVTCPHYKSKWDVNLIKSYSIPIFQDSILSYQISMTPIIKDRYFKNYSIFLKHTHTRNKNNINFSELSYIYSFFHCTCTYMYSTSSCRLSTTDKNII